MVEEACRFVAGLAYWDGAALKTVYEALCMVLVYIQTTASKKISVIEELNYPKEWVRECFIDFAEFLTFVGRIAATSSIQQPTRNDEFHSNIYYGETERISNDYSGAIMAKPH